MATEILVPTLGESITEATLTRWLKHEGEAVEVDDPVCELETDKVSLEIPAPTSGLLSKQLAAAGDVVEIGALLGTVEEDSAPKRENGSASESPTPKKVSTSKQPKSTKSATAKKRQKKKDVENAPSARRLMAERNVSSDAVTGSGRDGRIMKHDVPPDMSSSRPSPSSADETEQEKRVPMSPLRQTIAKRLKQAQETAAILTTFNEVDMSAVIALRGKYRDLFESKHNVRLGFMSFFVKACVTALREIPSINAEIEENDIIYKPYCHIGVAIGTVNGLVVPVLRDAHKLGFAEIERQIERFGALARSGKLQLSDLRGGTFTISNGGIYGSLMSTPIINPPQSAILGIHRIEERPVAIDGAVQIRPMMYLALSYDHRLIDGKDAVTFLVRVKESIEAPQRMLIDL